ncbi:MAG TPA: Clp protease N-terminal domain-containing protein, partial [Bellilinea sp.]|nr:Clp protease N-terminal domain-containing protein [Bellilinea sp.]
MNLDKFTQKSRDAILQSQKLAQGLGHQSIEPAHLLISLLRDDEGLVPAIITQIAGSPVTLRNELQKELDRKPKVSGNVGEVGLARETVTVLDGAETYAKGMRDEFVSTEHILLALADSSMGKLLSSYGATKDAILKALQKVRGSQRVTSENPEDQYQTLEKYG